MGRVPNVEPEWKGRSFWEKKEVFNYVGAVDNRTDMALCVREARAEGEKQLAEQIRQRIRTEFGSALEGQNMDGNTGSYVKDLIAKVSENVQVSGVKQAETFVEKVEETTGFGVKNSFTCYALLALDRPDYLEARKAAVDGTLAQVRQAQNAKAEESLKEAFEKLDGGAPSAGAAVQ